MSDRRKSALALALLALACGEPARPPPRAAPATAAPAEAAAADTKPGDAKPAEPEWTYSSVGKRDPFKSFLAEAATGSGLFATKCGTPLGRYELEQLKLVAVITGLEDPVAMVEAPSGVGYAVRRGACIGKNGGTVAAVRTGEVIVSEWVVRADGTRDAAQTVIRLPKEAAMNPEEAP